MALEDYLTEGEEILAQAGDFYATNRRVIKYRRSFPIGEEWGDIAYPHLSSISVVRRARRGLIWMGIIVASTALSVLFTVALMVPISRSVSGTSIDLGSWVLPSLVATVIGVVFLFVGLFVPHTYIQFRAAGIAGPAEAQFRLGGVRRQAVRALVRTVRQHSLGT